MFITSSGLHSYHFPWWELLDIFLWYYFYTTVKLWLICIKSSKKS